MEVLLADDLSFWHGGCMTLARVGRGKLIAGVCGGVARQFGWDVSLLRVLTLIGALFAGVTVFIYIALWILMPQDDF
jgi:phage shock protein C